MVALISPFGYGGRQGAIQNGNLRGSVSVHYLLEDESGIAQVTVIPDVYESVGAAVFGNAFLIVEGTVTPTGIGKSLKATKVWALR